MAILILTISESWRAAKKGINGFTLDENREKDLINKIIEQNENMKNKSITNPFKIDDRYIHLIWKTILDMSKSVQEKNES